MAISPFVKNTVVDVSTGVTEDEQNLANTIANNFSDNAEDFQQACKLYGSEFFEDETDGLRTAICSALKGKFTGFQNNYWNKWASLP